jgi:hypothetical protein
VPLRDLVISLDLPILQLRKLITVSELVGLSTDERIPCILSTWCSSCDCSNHRESELSTYVSIVLFLINAAVFSSFRSRTLS